MRKSFIALAAAALIVLAAPFAAGASGEEIDPTPSPTSTDYTPDQRSLPTLAGTTVSPTCVSDAPWIQYNIVLTDPDSLATDNTATLTLSDGVNTYSVVLGTLVNNQLSGRILWPGASVDPVTGAGTGWPGWAFVDGQWVETTGNFAWTRQPITATIEVNPEVSVPLSYPPATPFCVAGPRTATSGAAGMLSATGLSAAVVPIGIAGAALAIAGVTFVVLRRRRLRTEQR